MASVKIGEKEYQFIEPVTVRGVFYATKVERALLSLGNGTEISPEDFERSISQWDAFIKAILKNPDEALKIDKLSIEEAFDIYQGFFPLTQLKKPPESSPISDNMREQTKVG